jgi:hypothetical protein
MKIFTIYTICIVIVLFIKINLSYGQDTSARLYYDKSGFVSQTYVLLTIKTNKSKITVIRTAGFSAYGISNNSDLTETDTILKGLHIVYKSIKDSVYIFSKKDNFYFLTKDYKKTKLKQTDIKSDKLKQLRLMINNLDNLIGY